jgi:hypothetical protein
MVFSEPAHYYVRDGKRGSIDNGNRRRVSGVVQTVDVHLD